MMKVVFRVDASLCLGTGHVMRCLTLATALRERDVAAFFVCRLHAGHLCDAIEELGFPVSRLSAPRTDIQAQVLPTRATWLGASWQEDAEQTRAAIEAQVGPPDLLVVDHYALDVSWEQVLRALVGRVFVIDDLADRCHHCELLLDQNLHDSPESRYSGLVKTSTRLFIGPRYALLRPEFDEVAARLREGGVQRLLVYFGGTDPTNETLKLVLALRKLGRAAPPATFVLGPTNPHLEVVRQSARGMDGVSIVAATSRMATLMAEADLGIGTCGGAAWERCALGLPALVVVNAENQRDDARILHAMGAVRNLGNAATTSVEHWIAEIRALRNDPAALLDMSRASVAIMHGRKEARRDLETALVG